MSQNDADERPEDDEGEEQDELSPRYRRVKTPTIIQMEATECGAVSLGIILAYYGKYLSIEQLRLVCGVSRDGSNAFSLVQGAKKFGLEAYGYSVEVETLLEMDFPAILFWKFEHFLVLEGFSKDKVYINDPATGPRTISYDDLDQAFTGVVIILHPTAAFVKSGRPPSLWKALYKRVKDVKIPLFYIALTGIGMVIPNLAFPAFTKVFIDQVIVNNNLSWQNGIVFGLLIAIIGNAILTALQGKVLYRLQTRLSMRFSSDSLWHMLRLPISFYTQRYPGEIAYRMVLNDNVSRTLTGSLASTAVNVMFVFIYGVAMLYYDVLITLVAIGVIVLHLFLMKTFYRARTDTYTRFQSDLGKSISYSLGGLENIETIKATGMEYKFFSTWAGYYTKVVNVLQEVGKKSVPLSVLSPLLDALTMIVLIGIGGWKIIQGQMTIGMFVALQILLRNFMNPILQLVDFGQTIQFLKVDMARLDDIMSYPLDPVFKDKLPSEVEETDLTKLEGNVELRNVTFGFSRMDPAIIKEINFSLHPGKSIALVGSTGCGKSTIAKILGGLYEPWSGEIYLDGTLRDQVTREKIVNSLALVEQEPFLFQGTVRENLTLFDPTVAEENVFRAAKDACIHDEILARTGGYDMEVEENGANLSGGQKQRFEIARGLVKNPSILILDESTSALDSETETELIKNIRRRGCALLMIAHRLSTIRNCDEIMVMDKGQIVATGTHEELKLIPGLYRNLIESEHLEG